MPWHSLTISVILLISSARCFPAGDHTTQKPNHGVVALNKNFGTVDFTAGNPKINQIQQLKALLVPEPFPDSGRQKALKEQESPLSKKDSAYTYLQQFVANVKNVRPIVDTISEHEKYGNNGDQFRSVGSAIVGGFESLSNFLNHVVDVPSKLIKQFTRKATSTLSSIGGKLVGL